MGRKILFAFAIIIALVIARTFLLAQEKESADDRFVTYVVDTKKQHIRLFWKNDKQETFESIQNLKTWLNGRRQKLLFAMNGGMYKQDNSPQGLFIENQRIVTPLDTSNGRGNFYLKPNGVFYTTTDNIPVICTTKSFDGNEQIEYATQSGPMLVIEGHIHPAFKRDSKNLNIRNGVGILPGGKIVFAMSKDEISFYDFANHFKRLGCKSALYLDGFVSRTYLPEKGWIQTDGDFGVIIGVTN